MIKINLLPIQLRKPKTKVTMMPYMAIVVLAAVLLLLLTLFFFVDYLKVKKSYELVYREWQQVSPQMARLKTMENRVEVEMRGEKEFLEKNVLNTESMTRILMWISEYLPPHGWLTEIKIIREKEGTRLTVQGVVMSSSARTGVEEIEEFLYQLKQKLPQPELTLMTSKQAGKDGAVAGTSFIAQLDWGETKKK